ncbi:MAG: D-aminoacyl-tRNA deacylase [Candidatus Thermoplasmatota archaeon]|jgi:D-aminoacyl-tRNA deacylase|nr:D-aminoacyl-tRNA deacylase [Candidatus Thermoplasmatota archaeon]
MTVLIISSSEDPASTNMKNILLEKTTWDENGIFYDTPVYRHKKMSDITMVTISDRKIRHENIDKEVKQKLNIEPKIAIFLSRHRSKMGEPTLTVHPIGNYGDAEFGGKPRTLIQSAPRLMTHLLRLIKENLQKTELNYQVCYEVTHHGPYLEIPTIFAEVGSTEKQWEQKEPAQIISQSLLELLETYHYEENLPKDIPVLIGIGGGHYAPRFTEIALQKKVAFGHMIPTYHIDAGNITDEMIQKSLDKTPNVSGVYIHKKSLKKSQFTEYKKWFENKNIPVVSSKELSDL